MFYRSFTIRLIGNSKGFWIPSSWGLRKGDWVHVEVVIKGKTYHHTTKISYNKSPYLILPHEWDLNRGDIVDTRINYVTIPKIHRDEDDADSRTEDKEGD